MHYNQSDFGTDHVVSHLLCCCWMRVFAMVSDQCVLLTNSVSKLCLPYLIFLFF